MNPADMYREPEKLPPVEDHVIEEQWSQARGELTAFAHYMQNKGPVLTAAHLFLALRLADEAVEKRKQGQTQNEQGSDQPTKPTV